MELCASSGLQHLSSEQGFARQVKLGVREGAAACRDFIQSMMDWGVTGRPSEWKAKKVAPIAILVLSAEVRLCSDDIIRLECGALDKFERGKRRRIKLSHVTPIHSV